MKAAASTAAAAGALAAAALAASGCGEKQDVITPAAGGSGPQTVQVRETEYRIAPLPRISGPGTVRFQIRNAGKRTHALAIEGRDGGGRVSKRIAPRLTATMSVRLEPGSYEWYCPVDGHRGKGMNGSFRVGPGR